MGNGLGVGESGEATGLIAWRDFWVFGSALSSLRIRRFFVYNGTGR